MFIVYKDTFKSKLPNNIEQYKFTTKKDLKTKLQSYYGTEGNKPIAVYDCVIEDSTLFEIIKPYVDFNFIELHLFEPQKYYNLDNVNSYNVIFEMLSKDAYKQCDDYQKNVTNTVMTHMTDNTSSYFVTLTIDNIENYFKTKK